MAAEKLQAVAEGPTTIHANSRTMENAIMAPNGVQIIPIALTVEPALHLHLHLQLATTIHANMRTMTFAIMAPNGVQIIPTALTVEPVAAT